MNENNNIFSIPQAAKYCSISRVTLWRWVKSGKLKTFITPGGHHRILKKDLEAFMNANRMNILDSNGYNQKSILIVDDDPKMRALLRNMLSSENFLVEEAADGFEAGIKVMQVNPALIILDLHMPQMDGFEVCRQIKENSNTSHIKIIVLTALDAPGTKERVMELGADAYLRKPARKNTLLREIHELLG